MNKNTKVIIIASVIVLLIILMTFLKNRKNNNNIQVDKQPSMTTTTYNEEESMYKVVDKETGEVLYEGDSEAEAYLYQIDPTFRPSNPDAVDEEFEILEIEYE